MQSGSSGTEGSKLKALEAQAGRSLVLRKEKGKESKGNKKQDNYRGRASLLLLVIPSIRLNGPFFLRSSPPNLVGLECQRANGAGGVSGAALTPFSPIVWLLLPHSLRVYCSFRLSFTAMACTNHLVGAGQRSFTRCIWDRPHTWILGTQ